MTTLRTPRAILRRAHEDDVDAMHAVLSDPRAMRYWSTTPHETREQTRAWVSSMMASSPDESEDFVVELDGRVVGKVGFYRLPEIGFILHPDVWGRGLAKEVLASAIEHVFATRSYEVLIADVDPRNAASLAVLSSLGFREVRRAARTYCVGGEWSDSVYLELRRAPTRTP